MMRLSLLTLAILMTATAVHASSDDAWAKLNLKIAETCAAASGLKHAHVSEIIQFDDTLGKVATLVSGVFPQKALKGAHGKMLCIFDKTSGKAWIDEAKGWSAPDLR
ncbi:hypothetical protein C8J35_11026 [Rhizobium sp. PP-F2F-G38]|uniref:Uncharacterized protein n=1 Tax=Ferranicluibacter rubi TaxID=2715133 RepID=A0AA43ZEL7_9HYPH|nr:hypothetical protein [Ferranicluibacter rubi]NHT75600.1 hypothetical protein [Ferranicluibacter rubi]PYE30935.1 hypothetical protein C8J37_11458 [Rhizobium sp. PP-WC-1G-195]PYE94373.1 hypothetical protein C8J35_11026 [Rhizobium sp. PP-F2F-G38]TCQ08960.1 hypothetical protein C8J34_103348 [Rhizobium sp. PP-F2F-G36]